MRGAIASHPLALIGIGLAMVAGPVVAVEAVLGLMPDVGFLAVALADCVAALAGYAVFVHWVERRRMVELGGRYGWLEAIGGLALGAGLFSLTFGSIWGLGGVVVDGRNPAPDLSYAVGIAVMAGVVEELAIRGVVFRLLEGWLGSWAALALSAVLFGGLHLTNPGASLFVAVAIGLEAGVMLAAAFMVTRRLYLAIGLHIGWNFTQAGVFGVAVSGFEVGGWLQSRPVGPDWLSGGAFGAEASVLAVVWCVALGGALLALAGRRGRIVRVGASGGDI